MSCTAAGQQGVVPPSCPVCSLDNPIICWWKCFLDEHESSRSGSSPAVFVGCGGTRIELQMFYFRDGLARRSQKMERSPSAAAHTDCVLMGTEGTGSRDPRPIMAAIRRWLEVQRRRRGPRITVVPPPSSSSS